MRALFLLLLLATPARAEVSPREQAIALASAEFGGFLGTWVDAGPCGALWCVGASSKSANPPVVAVVDLAGGRVVYKAENADDAEVAGTAVEGPDGPLVRRGDGIEVRVAKRAAWPKRLRGQAVVARGLLRLRGEALVMEARSVKPAR